MIKKITISTAIAYPNAKPHIGHALEFVQADALARFYRLSGYDVMLTTGTDEHGTKIYKTAKDEGMTPEELLERNVPYFREICKTLNVSYDLFLRTSDEMLRTGAQKLWRKLVLAGDIYKASYEGLYCYGCENYMLEKDLVDGLCPNHMRAPEKLKEENYFFRLSKYKKWLEKHIGGELEVVGDFRVSEIKNMLEDLNDISFSRPKSVLPWGVTVPDDPEHVMYVWSDALANYLTGLDYVGEGETGRGENFKKYWPTTINIIGKDIMKFHAIYWPAMLKSAGLTLPKKLYIHGFITSEGKKMSKSLGNVVDPIEFAKAYGVDALRYYLLSQVPTQDDGDFSKERFFENYEAHLANNVGNLVSRVVAMVEKYFGGQTQASAEVISIAEVKQLFSDYKDAFEKYDIKLASEKVMQVAEYANKFVEDRKPWTIAKEASEDSSKKDELQKVMFHLLEVIRVMAVMLIPFIPAKAAAIFDSLGLKAEDFNFENMFEVVSEYKVKRVESLFPRIEQI